ncbi:DNA-3-methyladenine glycosylase I [Streptomyces sp. NPDC059651]|uniref:DNA-3-methyladenine glycosylase I n=1 Tax=Streptomyces sp. NPDC059651 TaxID=3346897 RepID=UPI0036A0DB44
MTSTASTPTTSAAPTAPTASAASSASAGAVPHDRADGGPVPGQDGLARCPWAAGHPLNRQYHDTEWGLAVRGEQALFERVTLEAFQAGLSWLTILAKRPAFRAAFDGFDPLKVAAYTDADVSRLMADAGIVRNRSKIQATVRNAAAVLALRAQGGLDELIWSHRPVTTPVPRTVAEVPTSTPGSKALARELRGRGFSFVGPTTAYALMEAIGMVDTHLVGCHRRGTSGVHS